MVRQHHQLNGHEFEQTLRDSEEQGRLLCCSLWGWTQIIVTKEQEASAGYQALSRVLGYSGDHTGNTDIVNGLLLICPEGRLQMLCRSLEIPLVAAFQSVSALDLEVLGLSTGKGEVPMNEFSLRDINH